MNLDELTHVDFEPLINTVFAVTITETDTISLELTSVRTMPESPQSPTPVARKQSFALIFRGPAQPLLPQCMYNFGHPTLGIIAGMFIVPIGANSESAQYEAVFN